MKALLMTFIAVSFSMAVSTSSAASWNYKHADQWGDTYHACKIGGLQSPINIDRDTITHKKAEDITPSLMGQPTNIADTGRTLQVNFANDGKDYFMIGDEKYVLLNIRFHSPSENTIDSKQYPLEAQFVTQNLQTKQLAIIAVMFEQSSSTNPILATMWHHLPSQKEQSVSLKNWPINLSGLLPRSLRYFHFEGSLTIPPCAHNVQWYVLQRSDRISAEDIATFKKLYPNNSRPQQPLNNRRISTSD